MNAYWRRGIVAVVLIVCLTSVSMAADVTGSYTCKGTNPNGSPYTGTTVIKENGGGYLVTWNIGGGMIYSGAGILTDNIFSASWGNGVVVYRVQNDGRLIGKWLNASGGELGTETLTPK